MFAIACLSRPPRKHGASRVGRPRQRPSGTTLLELLVVIGIVGVLIGITAPALRAVREAAGKVKSLANLRGIGQTLQLHTNTYHSQYPFYPVTVLSDGGVRVTTQENPVYFEPLDGPPGQAAVGAFTNVWSLSTFWPALKSMHEVAPWREHFAIWISPGLDRAPGTPWLAQPGSDVEVFAGPSYHYSNSFIADPRVWTPGVDVSYRDDYHPIRTFDVAQPSSKVVMFDADRAYLSNPWSISAQRPVLMADGSAAARFDREAAEPVQNQLSSAAPHRYHDTPGGVAGRDF